MLAMTRRGVGQRPHKAPSVGWDKRPLDFVAPPFHRQLYPTLCLHTDAQNLFLPCCCVTFCIISKALHSHTLSLWPLDNTSRYVTVGKPLSGGFIGIFQISLTLVQKASCNSSLKSRELIGRVSLGGKLLNIVFANAANSIVITIYNHLHHYDAVAVYRKIVNGPERSL